MSPFVGHNVNKLVTSCYKLRKEFLLFYFQSTFCSSHLQLGAPNDDFLLNSLERLSNSIQSTFRYLEMHSKRRCKIFICSVILGELESFEITGTTASALFSRKF